VPDNQKTDPAVIFRAAQLFLGPERKAQKIVDTINLEFNLQPRLTREAAYPLLQSARELGFIKLVPPFERQLAAEIVKKYGCPDRNVYVVDCPQPGSSEYVSAAAASLALRLARDLHSKSQQPVGLGLGPGRATLDFSSHLSRELSEDTSSLKLNLVAISAGCPAESPQYSSISFFNLFPPSRIAQKIGLFAETLVQNSHFDAIKGRPGVKEAFEAKKAISIVVTSMGDAKDKHDLLSTFMRGRDQWLKKQDCIGNVQYRPFSSKGPILENSPEALRAVTVFELDELAAMAMQKGKHVILIGRQCGLCGKSRGRALAPLLENERLRVFSDLVIDSVSAKELLDR
jgi:DNA-binding transcriptional regulator LsrR (DeoR family)